MIYLTDYLQNAINEENQDSIKFLKKINKGIYIHIFNPNENVYEKRKNIPHIIECGTTVIKPGKFTSGLYERTRGYTKCWKYESNDGLSFLNEVKSYLLVDLSEFENDYVARIEAGLTSVILYVLGKESLISYERGSKSEYRKLKEGICFNEKLVQKLSDILKTQIKHDMKLNFNKIYKSHKINCFDNYE